MESRSSRHSPGQHHPQILFHHSLCAPGLLCILVPCSFLDCDISYLAWTVIQLFPLQQVFEGGGAGRLRLLPQCIHLGSANSMNVVSSSASLLSSYYKHPDRNCNQHRSNNQADTVAESQRGLEGKVRGSWRDSPPAKNGEVGLLAVGSVSISRSRCCCGRSSRGDALNSLR